MAAQTVRLIQAVAVSKSIWWKYFADNNQYCYDSLKKFFYFTLLLQWIVDFKLKLFYHIIENIVEQKLCLFNVEHFYFVWLKTKLFPTWFMNTIKGKGLYISFNPPLNKYNYQQYTDLREGLKASCK